MTARVKACDFQKIQKTGASALFGAGVLLAAGSLNAALAAPADAAPQPYGASAKSLGDRVASTSYTAYQGAANGAYRPASRTVYGAAGKPAAQPATNRYAATTPAAPAAQVPAKPSYASTYATAKPSKPAKPSYASTYAAAAPVTQGYTPTYAPGYTPGKGYAVATYTPPAPAAGATGSNGLKPTMVFFSTPMRGFGINSRFGMRTMGKRTRPHEGVDFAAPMGSPVLCAADGRVVRTGTSSTYGRFVEVEHANGVTSFYAHLSAIGVQGGEQLNGGSMLGKVGSTGRSTGPHLHFEIRRNGQQVDPTGFLGKQFPGAGNGGFQVYKIIHGTSAGGSGGLRGVVAAE